MKEKVKIDEALAGLKDFQLKTTEYVFDQLYNKNRHKMLIADEVGLGKTIVAKGIIAKAFERYIAQGGPTKENPTFNVVYICSNLALAKQNIRKLNFLGDEIYVDDIISRLIYLAYKPDEKPKRFLINALTPGTSFNEGSHQGERNERAIIYRLLENYTPFLNRKNGLKWLLKGNIKDVINWEYTIDRQKYDSDLRADLFNKYRQELFNTYIHEDSFPRLSAYLNSKSDISLWHALLKICVIINGKNEHQFNFKNEIIRHLRRILSKVCLEYLNADIFILDEFQRYSNLIKLDDEAESPAIELARAIFGIKEAKILMLSATPFKPFTNDFDELNGEVHYKEFETVLKFLMRDEDKIFWDKFRNDRKAFFAFLRHPEQLMQNFLIAKDIKSNLEDIYRKTIVRTERLLAAEDRDALINSVLKDKPLEIQPEDIEDFVNLDKITQHLNKNHKAQLQIPIEYVKSSPFAFSYLDNYQHKKILEDFVEEDSILSDLIKKTGHAWLNLKSIDNYRQIIPRGSNKLPNAKLRLLLNETINNGGWKYLWIPPAIEYYNPNGPYKDGNRYSKSLIFSSWLLVPKMISSIVSYEAERYCIGNINSVSEKEKSDEKRNYFTKRRSPRPQFTFKVEKEGGEAQQMINMAYLFPSNYLSIIYDPIQNIYDQNTKEQLIQEVKNKISPALRKITTKHQNGRKIDWQKWYWAAPILLDKYESDNSMLNKWLEKGIPSGDLMIDSEDNSKQYDENSGKAKHFRYAYDVYNNPKLLELPELDEEQFEKILDFITALCLGSPSICYLRTQLKYYTLSEELLNASFNIADGFITLFNKPESIAILRLTTADGEYIDRVLEYSIDGNIQSLFDEYLYLLINCENMISPSEIGQYIVDILSTRTSSTQVDDLQSFLSRHNNGSEKKGKSLLGRLSTLLLDHLFWLQLL